MKVHNDYLCPWLYLISRKILVLNWQTKMVLEWERNRPNLFWSFCVLIILNNFDIKFGCILFGMKVDVIMCLSSQNPYKRVVTIFYTTLWWQDSDYFLLDLLPCKIFDISSVEWQKFHKCITWGFTAVILVITLKILIQK